MKSKSQLSDPAHQANKITELKSRKVYLPEHIWQLLDAFGANQSMTGSKLAAKILQIVMEQHVLDRPEIPKKNIQHDSTEKFS